MTVKNEVKILEDLKPEVVFSAGGSADILEAIKDKAFDFEPDVSSQKGRDEIKSRAYAISRSKTFLDKAGKDFKDQYQQIIKPIDSERKTIRDYLDLIQEEVRRPLTEYEAEEKRKQEEAEQKRQNEIRLENERLEKIEADKIALAEEEARKKQAGIDAENERVRLEQAEAQAKIDKANDEMNAKQFAIDEKNRIEREKIESEKAEIQAEKDAIAQQKIDEENQKIAIEEAKQQAIADEKQRAAEEKRIADEKAEDERLEALAVASQKEYREDVEKEILEDLYKHINWEENIDARMLIKCIKDRDIRHVSINY